ncbi:MAG: pyruvate kinase [Thaumarchaeota archaeon]|nr:pyruvate kinase [Nitrososphaerota archaeon]
MGENLKGRKEIPRLLAELEKIRKDMVGLDSRVKLDELGGRRLSATNLLHYVALRRLDIRKIQEELAGMGISSLGRSESHVLYNLDAVITILHSLNGTPVPLHPEGSGVTPAEGERLIEKNADSLFGTEKDGRAVRIMVTMPTAAATEFPLVRDLVAAGMDCMRINCAHDDREAWSSMIRNLRTAEVEVGRKCSVLMDIGGPKIRTGELSPGPQVLRIRPRRDSFGRVVSPARAVLKGSKGRSSPDDGQAVVQVEDAWLSKLEAGRKVKLKDARGAKRSMVVVARSPGSAIVESRKTIYLDNRTRLSSKLGGKTHWTKVENIPHREQSISLKRGNHLVVTADRTPGRPAVGGQAARISCTLPEALPYVKVGHAIWFDDGKIGGIVRQASGQELRVEITQAGSEGAELFSDKGINLPDSDLRLPSLTTKDKEDLRFIVKHADIVGYSFVRKPEDIKLLRSELKRLRKGAMAIVLKIETRKAFDELPSLLLEALRAPVSGVMIARGDLAVECGYERLAEVQEEILWMCEAAHLPAIWATQVLEGLTKGGLPSRAEVTDAAMGGRAECVMLNKGPHMVEALRALDNILRRMQEHQLKKTSLMRPLSIAGRFYEELDDSATVTSVRR